MPTALNKHSLFGFQIQSAEGSQISNSIKWVPFSDSLDAGENPNMTVHRQSDNTDFAHLMYSAGRWFEGGAPVTIHPTAGTLTALIDWIQTRDSYNQGKFASVYLMQRDIGVSQVGVDVKIARATFRFEKGRPVSMSLDLVGKSTGTPVAAGTCDHTGPYLWNEATITSNWAAGSLSADVNVESAEFTIDNMLEDAAEGLRIRPIKNLSKLYNVGGQDVTGSFTIDYTSSTIYAVWLAQMGADFSTTGDCQFQVVLSRGGVAITMLLNRLRFTNWDASPSGSNEGRIPQSVTFQGLGNDAGTLGPITLS